MVEFLFIIINYYYFYNHNNFEVNLILQMGLNIDKIDTKIEHIFSEFQNVTPFICSMYFSN